MREETFLDFSRPALSIHNKVRAFAGWPGTSGRLVEMDRNGKVEELDVKIIETRVWNSSETVPGRHEGAAPSPGLLPCGISSQKTVLIPCGEGTVLEVLQVRREAGSIA